MKIIKSYLFGELSPVARLEAEAASYKYAAGMLLQNNNCPAHMVPKMHQTFLDEYLGGYFDISGACRFPKFKDEEDKPALGGPGLKVLEGEGQTAPEPAPTGT